MTALVVRPRGRGGVASVIDAVAPHLGGVAKVRTGLRLGHPVVHLHPSFRWRAVLRDGAVHRLVRGVGARTLVQWHGVDRRLIARIDRSRRLQRALRGLYGDAGRTFVLIPELAEALERWGLGPAEVVVNPAPAGSGCAAQGRRVLFLGRLEEDKGVHALAVAIGILRRRHPDAVLALAGAGSQRVEGPGIERLGWIDARRRREELARASVLVLPTRDDAAPMAVLEALAAGVPVVATRIGALPAMVGEHGVIVERPDPASIVAGVEQVWARRFDAEAMRAHLAPNRPEAVAARWAAAYAEFGCASS